MPPFPPSSIWRFSYFLPTPRKIISMNEGNTPLVASTKWKGVSYKIEYANPTGSFKDRGSTVEISHAISNGFRKVVCASTGNMGASISAYAARAGIHATICVPHHVPENKITQIKAYGAKLVRVQGDYNEALKKTWEIASTKKGYMLTGDYPLRMEGQKTIALELVEQMKGKKIDQIICPIGNGTLITALHAGLFQLKKLKKIKSFPRLVGVQAENCAPLVSAWEKSTYALKPLHNPHTVAGAIECGNPIYGSEALAAVHETQGEILAVSEKRMKESKISLAKTEGLYAEYSGAAVQAVVEDYDWKGNTIALLCGHGLKE
ncbi:MAG: threonine synthase [Candidatus Diapherotrites archaeon]